MSVIGVYDSGIGGLTTLSALKRVLVGHDFYYLADTKAMPFGTKTKEEIYSIVTTGLKMLKDNSDFQVIACNTASTVVAPKDAFLLKPNLDGLTPHATLFLSTPATMKALDVIKKGYGTADTKNLATMVEIMGSLSYKSKGKMGLEQLSETVKKLLQSATIDPTKTNKVLLGCSHYVYIKPLLKAWLPWAEIVDGNSALSAEILSKIPPSKKSANEGGKIEFAFTLGSEKDKYDWMIKNLDKNQGFWGI